MGYFLQGGLKLGGFSNRGLLDARSSSIIVWALFGVGILTVIFSVLGDAWGTMYKHTLADSRRKYGWKARWRRRRELKQKKEQAKEGNPNEPAEPANEADEEGADPDQSQAPPDGGQHEAMLSLDLQSPITIHWIAFVPVIMSQGTPDQIDRWGSRAMRHEIMGAYLQTELGHGSNVAGLETTATFDKASAIIHSSTLTSTKWHAVVQAQLILDGKGIGPHLFFVPLRSVETGQLFEGVHAGDIGPKAYGAFGGLDNGWARSDHYRIPRENMFMKHSQVTKEGQYVKPPSSKMSYLGLTFIRSQMIDRCGWMLSRGITIAIRYSSVRRQFRGPDSTTKSDEERAVIS
ncbi:unnamed protein product [Tilletia controversa]|nr:unnamed protein product [Tilletia controversa]